MINEVPVSEAKPQGLWLEFCKTYHLAGAVGAPLALQAAVALPTARAGRRAAVAASVACSVVLPIVLAISPVAALRVTTPTIPVRTDSYGRPGERYYG